MRTPSSPDLERRMADALRMLAVDAVERANSGHPGAPMGMADMAQVLWHRHLRHNPANPHWPDRDRFVLSNGHASMLLYALLHLTGYDLPIDELKAFRRLHSRTPGHPEVGVTPGVETTTGPLGQGLANAVGMALAEKLLAQEFNREHQGRRHDIVDHFTYVFLGDGCLMEGISHEACSLAGTLRLSKLIALYDDNGISIDGHVAGWFTDHTAKRFEAYGWNVIAVDGHDPAQIEAALLAARALASRDAGGPTLICCKTIIGKGSPNKGGSHDVHGAALGAQEVEATRRALGWTAAPFEVPAELAAAWDARERGAAAERDWRARFEAYRALFPDQAAEFERRTQGQLPARFAEGVAAVLDQCANRPEPVATRKASQLALDALAPLLPELFGGSADLTSSNLTNFKGSVTAGRERWGNHLSYGVREFAMAAVMNGMALHRGHIPYGGTFLTFSDYSRNAIRMAALMKLRVIHVLTHDSIGLGEDGPTHQSVEHIPVAAADTQPGRLAALRQPRNRGGLDLRRRAQRWAVGVVSVAAEPAAPGDRSGAGRTDPPRRLCAVRHGGRPGRDPGDRLGSRAGPGGPGATGLRRHRHPRRVDALHRALRPAIGRLPGAGAAVAIAGGGGGSRAARFLAQVRRPHGAVIGMTTFGESAPAKDLYAHFGITAEQITRQVRRLVQQRSGHRALETAGELASAK